MSSFSKFGFCGIYIWLSTSCRTPFLTEDGLFDIIRASNHTKAPAQEGKKSVDNAVVPVPKESPKKVETKSMFS